MVKDEVVHSGIDPLLKNIIKNTGINTFGTVFNKLLHYVSLLIVIKILGVTNYGYYTIGLTILSFGMILSNAGFNYGVFRFIPIFIGQNDTAKVKGVISFSLGFVAFSGITIALSLFLFSEIISVSLLNKPDLVKYIKLFSLTLPFTVISGIIINIFKGFNLIKYKVLVDDFTIIVSRTLLFLCCLVLGLGITGVIISHLASTIVGLIIGIILLIKIFPDIVDGNVIQDLDRRKIISYSFPLFLSSFFALFLNRIDILMLSYYLSADQIGIYSISSKLASIIFFFASSTFAIFSPTIAKLFGEGNREGIGILLNKVTRLVWIATIPVYLIITIFTEELLMLFGKEFTTGYTTLLILASSLFFNSLIGFTGQILGVVGRSKLILINSLTASILNIGLNYILIPQFGIIGAAVATGFSIFAVNVARTIEVYILEDISILKPFLIKPLLIGIAAGGTVLYLKQLLNYQVSVQSFFTFAIIFILLYCLLLWIFIFTREEKQFVYNCLNKIIITKIV